MLCIYIGAIQQVHHLSRAWRYEWVDKINDKKWHRKEGMQSKEWCPSHKIFLVLFVERHSFRIVSGDYSVTQSFLLEALIILQWTTRKTRPRACLCIWDNYITFAQNCYNSTCQYGLFISSRVSKIVIVSKSAIIYLLWYNMMRWSSHIYTKNRLSSYPIVC